MLQIRKLCRRYTGPSGEFPALSDVSLTVDAGEFVAVQGPSGCGKSTLLLAAGALLHPHSGSVAIGGVDPYAMSPEARAQFRAKTIGFVFQQFHLVPYLSVLDNVRAAALAAGHTDGTARARELIEKFGLAERIAHVPSELSTGERQRVAMARALLNGPRLLLADEPTGNLDAANGEIVLQHLVDFTAAGGAVLLVTHDARAAGFARRVITLRKGQIE